MKTINQLEREAIENALVEYNFDLTETSKALGVGRATVYRKVKQHCITRESLQKRLDDRNFEKIVLSNP